ncbi:hypothetical protein ACHAQJ_002169 [Trichoderma viride]
MRYRMKPPEFEIADLRMSESDPTYPDAVRCVQTYWKQATNMNSNQRLKYIWYVQGNRRKDFLVKPFAWTGGTVTAHSLYQRACDDEGGFCRLSWAAYLFLSTLYGDLPNAYKEAVAERYGTSIIADHSNVYRHFYPAPASTTDGAVGIWTGTSHLNNNTLRDESFREQTSTWDGPLGVTPKQEDVDATTSSNQQLNPLLAEYQYSPASSTPEKALVLEPWRFDDSLKRAKLLKQANQQTEIIQQTIHDSQSNQNVKLQEIHNSVQQHTQALRSIQSDLRQFMSAASTLRVTREPSDK